MCAFSVCVPICWHTNKLCVTETKSHWMSIFEGWVCRRQCTYICMCHMCEGYNNYTHVYVKATTITPMYMWNTHNYTHVYVEYACVTYVEGTIPLPRCMYTHAHLHVQHIHTCTHTCTAYTHMHTYMYPTNEGPPADFCPNRNLDSNICTRVLRSLFSPSPSLSLFSLSPISLSLSRFTLCVVSYSHSQSHLPHKPTHTQSI